MAGTVGNRGCGQESGRHDDARGEGSCEYGVCGKVCSVAGLHDNVLGTCGTRTGVRKGLAPQIIW